MAEFPNPPILTSAPTDGQVPAFQASTNTWIPATQTGATGPTGPSGSPVPTVNAQTGTTYTPTLSDGNNIVTMSNASANTFTIPTHASVAFAVGTKIDVIQLGAGVTALAAAGGVTLDTRSGDLHVSAQYGKVTLIQVATDVWVGAGDLTT